MLEYLKFLPGYLIIKLKTKIFLIFECDDPVIRKRKLTPAKEAWRILADFPTFEQMVEDLKAKHTFPPEVWKLFDDVIARRAEQKPKCK
jgi:adenylate kinase